MLCHIYFEDPFFLASGQLVPCMYEAGKERVPCPHPLCHDAQ